MSKSSAIPVQYEVTAIVRPDLVDSFEAFLGGHVVDVLATGCFTSAAIDRGEPGHYRVCYRAPARDVLDRYLAEHAPRLRDDTRAHFPAGIDFSRAIWTQWKRIDA